MNSPARSASQAPPRLRLRVSPVAEQHIRAGHPWVYSDSIRETNRPGAVGELAVIFDRNDNFLAIGFFDPESPIRVRILHVGKPRNIDSEFWRDRLELAVQRRANLFDATTTGYRLINGESDGWPGLVMDRYDAIVVLKIYTAAWVPLLPEIIQLIRKRLEPATVIVRSSRNIEAAVAKAQLLEASQPPSAQSVVFSENGIRFEADVWRGQKTGFFLDQRENRRLVETFARGGNVLNAFSFSGGFSLYAARGGAKSVTDLDISKHALDSARRNFALNATDPNISRCRHDSIQADCFEWLTGNAHQRFELIVLDPPSLAKRETERAGAIRAYTKLIESGIQHLATGGILVACSCSAHVSADEFFNAARIAARQSGRAFSELQTTRHAPDHHATFTEAEYLKGIYLRF